MNTTVRRFLAFAVLACLVWAAPASAQPGKAETIITVSRAYFKAFFVGDQSALNYLEPNADIVEAQRELTNRKGMIQQLGITNIDWTPLAWKTLKMDDGEAVVMGVGYIILQTPEGSRQKEISRVIKLRNQDKNWFVADSYYGEYTEASTTLSEEKLKRIEEQISKDRVQRYEDMYGGVRKPYDPTKDPDPSKNPAPSKPAASN